MSNIFEHKKNGCRWASFISFLLILFVSGTLSAHSTKSAFAAKIEGLRFTATRAYNRQIEKEQAMAIAENAARSAAMKAVMRTFVALPEVRVAASPGSLQSLSLLALAHASVNVPVLFVSHSRKDSLVTVTVVVTDTGMTAPIENRIREALAFPERLSFYEEAVFREEALTKEYDALFPVRKEMGKKLALQPLPDETAKRLEDIAKEIKALSIYKEQLPNRGNVWNNPERVRHALQKALMLAPDSALIHNGLGDVWLQLGRSQEALEAQNLAIKAQPDFARAYHSRGIAAMALGHLSSAVADFSEAIRLSPHTATYYRSRGFARHLLGDVALMCGDFLEACSLGDCQKLQWAMEERLCITK